MGDSKAPGKTAAGTLWSPRWGNHVTQIHKDGSGWNDCAEAALTRAILEYDCNLAARRSDPQWDLARAVHDPNEPQGPMDMINQLSIIARGSADHPGNGFTGFDGVWRVLKAFGLDSASGYFDQQDGSDRAYKLGYQRPMSLCWVDGVKLAPASFPASFFGGDWGWDHFILWLPYRGNDNTFNDPLTVQPDTKTDVRYNLNTLRWAMGGVFLLPNPENLKSPNYICKKACGLKSLPNHICKKIRDVRANDPIKLTGQTHGTWTQIISAEGDTGWIETINVKEVQ